MAHAQDVGSLLDQLIFAHLGSSPHATAESLKCSALRIFSSNKTGRTNQFEVHARLEGLVEKLRILNNDGEADRLQERRDDLLKHNWDMSPEALSLLLLLSNRPAQRPGVEDLSIVDTKTLPVSHSWSESDLNSSTGEETGLWKDVDFVNESSDEEGDLESVFSDIQNQERQSSSPSTEESTVDIDDLIVHVQRADLVNLRDTYWLARSSGAIDGPIKSISCSQIRLQLTELQAIREVVYMLLGLPTTIFQKISANTVELSKQVELHHALPTSIRKLMDDFAVIGAELNALRNFINRDEDVPLIQTFQALIGQRIQEVDAKFNAIQIEILNTQATYFASLLQLYEEATQTTRLISHVTPVVKYVAHQSGSPKSFSILEGLYDSICTMHSTGELASYEFLTSIFFQCLQTYLKPISLWMESGELDEYESTMFIQRNDLDVPLDSLWQDQFSLVTSSNGLLHAPSFLHLAARKIFNTGKSVHFLRKLGEGEGSFGARRFDGLPMSFSSVCQQADPYMLSPFPAIFDSAFDDWIARRHRSSSSLLRQRLEDDCGLQSSLDALEYLFFSKNSILSGIVLSRIFERLDGGKRHWNDTFILTEFYHDAFKDILQVNVNNIGVRSTHKELHRSMSALETLSVTYGLPWPVANIIRPSSKITYQRVFIFLAQVYRAKFLLLRHKLPDCTPQKGTQHLHQIYSLRTHLLYFVDTLLTHITTMVISVCTARMRHSIAKAEDVDSMVAVHTDYILAVEDQCLLTKKHASLKQAVVSILDLTVLFSDALSHTGRGEANIDKNRLTQRLEGPSEDSSEDDEIQAPAQNRRNDLENADLRQNNDSHGNMKQKLEKIRDTYAQLQSFVVANVQGLSKSDGATCWEVWAGNLEAGRGS